MKPLRAWLLAAQSSLPEQGGLPVMTTDPSRLPQP